MRSNAKYWYGIAVFMLAAMIIVLSGCDEQPETKTVTITVQMFEGPEYDAMVPTAAYWNEHYSAKTGITVKPTYLNRIGYFEKLHIQLIAGQSEPDIVHPFSLHLGQINKYLEPLDSYLSNPDLMKEPDGSELDKDTVLSAAWKTVMVSDKKTYMVPVDMSEVILFYRKDLITEPPQTWDDFINVARNFTQSHNSNSPTPYGAIVQGKYEMWTFCAALETFWPFGSSLVDEGGKNLGFKGPATKRAFQVFETLTKDKILPPGAENAEYPQVAEAVKSGRVAMAIQWNAFYNELIDPVRSPKVYDKFDIAPPPGVQNSDGSLSRSMYVQTIGLAVNRASKNKEAAMRFLTWASLGEGALVYNKAGGSSPIKPVWEGPDAVMPYRKLAPWVPGLLMPLEKS